MIGRGNIERRLKKFRAQLRGGDSGEQIQPLLWDMIHRHSLSDFRPARMISTLFWKKICFRLFNQNQQKLESRQRFYNRRSKNVRFFYDSIIPTVDKQLTYHAALSPPRTKYTTLWTTSGQSEWWVERNAEDKRAGRKTILPHVWFYLWHHSFQRQ